MENSISTGTKEFVSTHPTRAREKDNNYGFRRVLSAGMIDQQPISNDRVIGEGGLDEKDDATLYDSSPGRCEGRTWIAQQYRQPRRAYFRISLRPNRNLSRECF